jgi:hypothetical protein
MTRVAAAAVVAAVGAAAGAVADAVADAVASTDTVAAQTKLLSTPRGLDRRRRRAATFSAGRRRLNNDSNMRIQPLKVIINHCFYFIYNF